MSAALACLLPAALLDSCVKEPEPPVNGFSRKQLQRLFDPSSGTEARTQFAYHYLKKDRDEGLRPPAWLDKAVREMAEKPAWKDEGSGSILSQATLWRAPFAVLYEFFELVRETLPSSYNGKSLPLPDAAERCSDGAMRFDFAVYRLKKADLGLTMDGRGRELIETLDRLPLRLTAACADARDGKPDAFARDVLVIAEITEKAYLVLGM